MANPVHADSRGLGLLLALGVALVLSLCGFALLKSGAAVVVTDSRVVTVIHANEERVVLQLQAELDADGPAAALAHSRRVTALIGLGYTADQILDGPVHPWRASPGDCWGETGYSSSRIEPGSIRARVVTEDARRKVAQERTGSRSRPPAGTPRPCG